MFINVNNRVGDFHGYIIEVSEDMENKIVAEREFAVFLLVDIGDFH